MTDNLDLHLRLGGGLRHKLAICAAALIAQEQGYIVRTTTTYRPGKDNPIPDLIIKKKERVRGREVSSTYRVEIVDTHDPEVDAQPGGGFTDVYKIFLKRADEYCSWGGLKVGEIWSHAPIYHEEGERAKNQGAHPLCLEGLFWLCRQVIP